MMTTKYGAANVATK